MRPIIRASVILVALVGLFLGGAMYFLVQRGPVHPSAATISQLPEFSLYDLNDRATSSSTWGGDVLVLNFWATWCEPCRHEIPVLDAIYRQNKDTGLTIAGVAIDRKPDVSRFITGKDISYPIFLGNDDSIELSIRLGNESGGLPFTVVFDRQGRVRERVTGQFDEVRLKTLVAELL